MADIELVIKIPEEKYNYAKKQVAEGIDNPWKVYIATGTPLPKVLKKLNGEWIPCSERMPDDDTIINVIVSGYEVWSGKKTLFVDWATYPGSYIDGFDTNNDWDEGQEVHILAWMPLPEPYGGEEE